MANKAEPNDEPGAEVAVPETQVKKVGDWHLVAHGTWEISVAPDGLLMLPRHLHPREVADFVAAATAASQVGATVIADNEARAEGDDRTLPPAKAIVTAAGAPVPGAMRMSVAPGPNQARPQRDRATIGRNGARRRGGRAGSVV